VSNDAGGKGDTDSDVHALLRLRCTPVPSSLVGRSSSVFAVTGRTVGECDSRGSFALKPPSPNVDPDITGFRAGTYGGLGESSRGSAPRAQGPSVRGSAGGEASRGRRGARPLSRIRTGGRQECRIGASPPLACGR
jgi:hypothetical protein